jgi:hydrogenase maturation protease
VSRLLVAGVGNVLRRDDGFGPVVVDGLGGLPPDVDVVETGIGGVALLQEILAGCDGLVIVDALDRGEAPGTVLVVEPEVDAAAEYVPDVHLVDPGRVLTMAKAMGVLPDRVLVVGCQPADASTLERGLSPEVSRAVAVARERVREIVWAWARAAA